MIVIVLSLASCRSLRRIEYVFVTDTNVVVSERHDTLREETHDTVFHTIKEKGDTVFDTQYIVRYKYKERVVNKTDTVVDVKTEYVDKEVVVEKRHIPKWCYVCLAIALAFTLITIYKVYKWLR